MLDALVLVKQLQGKTAVYKKNKKGEKKKGLVALRDTRRLN